MGDTHSGRAPDHAMTDFVVGVVRTAFLVRLAALVFVLLLPVSDLAQGRVIAAIAVIAASSVLGFYRHQDVVRVVRRHPLIATVDVLVAAGLAAVVGADSPLLFYTLSTAVLIGVLLPPVSAALLTLVLVLSQLLAIVETTGMVRDLLFPALVLPVTCVVIVLVGMVARILHEQVVAEHARTARLRAEAAKHEERARLAREMHDSVAKSLHGIGLAAAALPKWLERDPKVGARYATAIRRAADVATEEARALLSDVYRETSDRPLADVLDERVRRFGESAGVTAELDLEDVHDVAGQVRAQLIRILDEALENVARHAEASRVTVRCEAAEEGVVVEVSDDGHGFDVEAGRAKTGHFGLRGMDERARAVGGRVDVVSSAGVGTSVRVTLPAGAAPSGEGQAGVRVR